MITFVIVGWSFVIGLWSGLFVARVRTRYVDYGWSFVDALTGGTRNRFVTRYRLYRACGFNRRASWFGAMHGAWLRALDSRVHDAWFPMFVMFTFVFASGCVADSPTRPTSERTARIRTIVIPEWHGRPASMPDGSIVTICATQPRTYCVPDAPNAFACTRRTETDAYIIPGNEQCPTIPID